ncbi:MAG TPA: hypothetical protein VFK16_06320 [Gemmatimonadaceae bacterium]|nr:hypothetical protein [Gemmatimonadaceae bacterium]
MRYPIRLVLAALAVAGPALSAQLPITLQHARPVDQRGVNMFEPPKQDTVSFTGPRVNIGAAFRQDFQALQHENTAAPRMVTVGGVTTDANQLITVGHGFNNAVANLYLDAQLAKGIRVAMTSYLSARHHNETWVKDGYILIDASPFNNATLDRVMKYTTVKVGEFEMNYGDGHFRRTDNGQALYNPLVGNYILDAFTTEIGAEVYLRKGSWLGMAGLTNGEIHGMVLSPDKRAPAFYGKVGFDRQVDPDLRVRLTGSAITQARSTNQSLYGGDRAGSVYYDIMENTTSTESSNAWSGRIRNPFSSKIQGQVINPFVKYGNAEFFGQFEWAQGNNGPTEPVDRHIQQQVYEGVYRLANDQLYLAGRYDTFSGRLAGIANDVSVDRYQVGGGWYVTQNLLAKLEWVDQKYHDFPATDIRAGGHFKGFMVSAGVAF